ncbi:TPA: response regulator transcription factor [Photobacterium damselae]|uniref:DNA-binding response regulator n=1 Tax=Photobacterium damselae TaxID=38293 RepID=A0ABD6X3Q9_PHODM|nr:response regulator [Photobacterium damselae]ELI6450053.1 response regulator transcription factor [Photobacterium damselae]ELV7518766.1 response regulator transcription factor [Photobacterium damselae]MCG3825167.1 response regulator transcription factor [Photobacterium damselae]OBU42656.1 DNA-binding response regulator [Photobacterium damselae]PSU17312.1 DNA-binding response regulator [Photobacterium damselae]
MLTKPHLFLVDDDDAVLDALEFVLQGEGYEPHCFLSADLFWQFIQQQGTMITGCLVLDSRMPGMSGQELQIALNQIHSSLGIIFLTGHGDIPMAVDALKSGAVDFLLKPIHIDSLLKAIKNALEYSSRQIIRQLSIEKYKQLTQRERDMLALFAKGNNNIDVSNELHISPRTVEVHKSNLLRHLGVTTLAEMITIYTHVESILDTIPPPPTRIKRK